MPFTPLHMGPGILVKATLRRSFSLMVFGWAQILMDIQPLLAMITGKGELHGFTHTYMGAVLIALLAALTGKHASELGLRLLRQQHHLPIGWQTAFLSAFIGTFSHVLLDSVMHYDIHPYAPFSEANGLVRIISLETLHGLCLFTAVVGAVIYFGVSHLLSDRQRSVTRDD